MKKIRYKRLLRTIGISEQWTLLCEAASKKKLLTSCQIFQYAVPARIVTKTLGMGIEIPSPRQPWEIARSSGYADGLTSK